MAEEPKTPSFEDLAASQALASGGGETGGSKIDSMKIYVGSGAQQIGQLQQTRETAGLNLPPVSATKVPTYSTVGQVATDYFRFDYKTRQSFINSLKGLGQDTSKMTDADYAAAWRAYTIQAAQQTVNGRNMTTWDVIALDLLTREGQRQQEAQKGPKTTTTTQTQTSLSTQLDAKAMLYQASKTLLGRAPTDAEANNFFSSLNAAERANPQTTTTTSTTAPTGELISQNQTVEGGISADAKQLLVQEEAQKNPEYGAYQVSTRFLDGLMQEVYGKGY